AVSRRWHVIERSSRLARRWDLPGRCLHVARADRAAAAGSGRGSPRDLLPEQAPQSSRIGRSGPSGRGPSSLPDHEARDLLNAVQVRRNRLMIGNVDTEIALQELHQFQYTRGIDHTRCQQGLCIAGNSGRVPEQAVRHDELPNLRLHVVVHHALTSPAAPIAALITLPQGDTVHTDLNSCVRSLRGAAMPPPHVNVSAYLLGEGRPDDLAIIDRTGRHTYAALRRATAALAETIATWHLPPGARIGLLSRNSLFWVAAYLAILHAGHVAVPFATTLTPQDIRRKAGFVDCTCFMFDSGLSRTQAAAISGARHVADETSMAGPNEADRGFAAAATDKSSSSLTPQPVHEDVDAVLMFTSGTTASPRAVRVTHGNIRANTAAIGHYLEL